MPSRCISRFYCAADASCQAMPASMKESCTLELLDAQEICAEGERPQCAALPDCLNALPQLTASKQLSDALVGVLVAAPSGQELS